MIAAVSPSSLAYEDTYNTLKYANRAKEIKLSVRSSSSAEGLGAGGKELGFTACPGVRGGSVGASVLQVGWSVGLWHPAPLAD